MTLQEAARRLGVHYTTVKYYIATGKIMAVKDGKTWNVNEDSVNNFTPPEKSTAGRAGRKAGPEPAKERGVRSIYLGLNITPEQIAEIRRKIPADTRGLVLLKLTDGEKLKRVLAIITED